MIILFSPATEECLKQQQEKMQKSKDGSSVPFMVGHLLSHFRVD
jgi:hypothetical protein